MHHVNLMISESRDPPLLLFQLENLEFIWIFYLTQQF